MGNIIFSNNASALLAATIDDDDTVVQVAAGFGALFPSPTGDEYFVIALMNDSGDLEIMHCTTRSVDNLTVERAQEGTVAQAWTQSLARVELRLTAGQMNSFFQNNAPLQAEDGTAAIPVYTFASDTDSGMYLDAANQLGFAVGGAVAARVNSNGLLLDVGSLRLTERAAAVTDVAGIGQLWVRTATPNELWFTDDAGNDEEIAFVDDLSVFALDSAVVHDTGTETIAGAKTFSSAIVASAGVHSDAGTAGNPGYAFDDDGDTGMYRSGTAEISWACAGVQRMVLSSAGALTCDNDITAFSDRRLKKDLFPIKSALEKVLQLTGYTYARTDDPMSVRRAGLIAQEVEEVLPEVVHYDSEGVRSLAYGNMVALLVEAIKELHDAVAG